MSEILADVLKVEGQLEDTEDLSGSTLGGVIRAKQLGMGYDAATPTASTAFYALHKFSDDTYASFTSDQGDRLQTGRITIKKITEQLRLGYDTSNFAGFTVDVDGKFDLTASGDEINFGAGNINIEGRAAFEETRMGYGETYRALVVGNATTARATVFSLGLNFDPSVNANGIFEGDGREILLRNIAVFQQTNAANDGWIRTLALNNGQVGIGMNAPNERLTVEGAISLDEIAAPTATAGYGKLYFKTDGFLYAKNGSGTESQLTS